MLSKPECMCSDCVLGTFTLRSRATGKMQTGVIMQMLDDDGDEVDDACDATIFVGFCTAGSEAGNWLHWCSKGDGLPERRTVH